MLSDGAPRTWLNLGLTAPFKRLWCLFEYRGPCLRDYGEKLSSSGEGSRHYRTSGTKGGLHLHLNSIVIENHGAIYPSWDMNTIGVTQNISSSETLMGLGENYINCEKTNLVIILLKCTLSFHLIWGPSLLTFLKTWPSGWTLYLAVKFWKKISFLVKTSILVPSKLVLKPFWEGGGSEVWSEISLRII